MTSFFCTSLKNAARSPAAAPVPSSFTATSVGGGEATALDDAAAAAPDHHGGDLPKGGKRNHRRWLNTWGGHTCLPS